jgi:hypothetical protein
MDQLFDPSERHLPLDEAIRRIAPAFRRVSVDRERGDARVRERYERMVAGGTPELILQSQRGLFGHAAWVSVSDDNDPSEWIEFLVIDAGDVWIGYRSDADRSRFRPTVLRLASLLGYAVSTRDSQEAEPDGMMSTGLS